VGVSTEGHDHAAVAEPVGRKGRAARGRAADRLRPGHASASATKYTSPDAFQIISAGPTGKIATLGYGQEPTARWEFDDASPEKFSLDDDPRGR
jgi:hypothetical protein